MYSANPIISVILPVYQGEANILRAVQSVLNQTVSSFELIVINDGSTDRTGEILASIQDSRLVVLNQENQGVAAARNDGFQHARGEYIAFIDADDQWLSDRLAVDLKTLENTPGRVCMIYGGYYAVDADQQVIHLPPVPQASGVLLDEALKQEGLFLPSTTLVHRHILEATGGFPTRSYHEDRTFFIRAASQFPAYPTGERKVLYQQTLSGRCRRVLKDYDAALKAELSILSDLETVLSPEKRVQLKALQLRNLFYRFLMYGYLDHAKRLYQEQVSSRISWAELVQEKKGLLAFLSLITGWNLLFATRILLQSWNKRVYRRLGKIMLPQPQPKSINRPQLRLVKETASC